MREPFIFHTDSADFQATVRELMKRCRYKTIPEFVAWRARILVYDLIGFTPPRAGKDKETGRNLNTHESGRIDWVAQKKAGEGAVRRDIKKLFPELSSAHIIKHPFEGLIRWARDIEKYIKARNFSAIEKMLNDAGVEAQMVLMDATPEAHRGARGDRGRVKAGVRYPVINISSVATLIRNVIRSVGKLKAGWLKAAIALGTKGIPVWVTRHKGIPGDFIDDRYHPRFPSITVGNRAAATKDMDPNELVAPAIAINERKMKKELEKILEWEFRKANTRK